jgi:DNA-binding transcriptional MocR family regulator
MLSGGCSRPDREMRLGFGGASEPETHTGIARLGAVLSDLLE